MHRKTTRTRKQHCNVGGGIDAVHKRIGEIPQVKSAYFQYPKGLRNTSIGKRRYRARSHIGGNWHISENSNYYVLPIIVTVTIINSYILVH